MKKTDDVLINTRDKDIRKNVWWGMAINIALTVLKMVVGVMYGSRALVSDAFHSFSDFFTDAIIILGSHFWSRPPDAEHPYGHRRLETIVSIVVGTLLAAAGIGIGWNAVHALMHNATVVPPGWVAFWIAVLSIVSKEWLYHWTVAVGKRTKSLALVANAWHHRSDALSSIPVALAIAGSRIFPALSFLDSLGAILVSLLLVQVAYRIVRPAFDELLESGAPSELAKEIETVARGVEGVKDVHSVRTRYFGSQLMVDMHVLVDPRLTVQEGHAISSEVCKALHVHTSEIIEVLNHIEPYEGEAKR